MIVPPGYDEEAVVAIINRVASYHAATFSFGSYVRDDIYQESWLICLNALEVGQYDPARPLENYLHACVSKRLLNLYRNQVRRNDPPCKACHMEANCNDAEPGNICEAYSAWRTRNDAKASLAQAADPEDDRPSKIAVEPNYAEKANVSDMVSRVDRELPPHLRSDYLRMRAGETIPKARRRKVEDAVRQILSDHDTEV